MSTAPALVIIMGTSGCGKSSIGLAVAQQLGVPFVDGDDLHPASNVQKMSQGTPLTDEDRFPWLARIRSVAKLLTSDQAHTIFANPTTDPSKVDVNDQVAQAVQSVHPASIAPIKDVARPDSKRRIVVIGCSALKVIYRDLLRGKDEPGGGEKTLETFFVYLHGTRTLLLNRMNNRGSHFFKPSMLDSQLATLERPVPGQEPNVAEVRLGQLPDEVEEVGVAGVVEKSGDFVRAWLG
ncbi:carbohydrate kinase [Meredithblackwellia eburnea MCA 4105]